MGAARLIADGPMSDESALVIAREDITDRQKEKILCRNAERFYSGK